MCVVCFCVCVCACKYNNMYYIYVYIMYIHIYIYVHNHNLTISGSPTVTTPIRATKWGCENCAMVAASSSSVTRSSLSFDCSVFTATRYSIPKWRSNSKPLSTVPKLPLPSVVEMEMHSRLISRGTCKSPVFFVCVCFFGGFEKISKR